MTSTKQESGQPAPSASVIGEQKIKQFGIARTTLNQLLIKVHLLLENEKIDGVRSITICILGDRKSGKVCCRFAEKARNLSLTQNSEFDRKSPSSNSSVSRFIHTNYEPTNNRSGTG